VVDVLALLSAIGGIGGLATIVGLAYWLGRKFESIESRFREIDRRFERIEDAIEGVKAKIDRLGMAFTNYQEFFVEYLASEGALRPQSASLLAREARRLIGLVLSNPLSPEEKERLRELFEKSERGDLTVDEAYELLELARKILSEYGDRPEAWKFHAYAALMVGLAIRREGMKSGEGGRG